jgi:hypothetical protein
MEGLEAHAKIANKAKRRVAAFPNENVSFSTARSAMEPLENLLDF